MGCVSSKSGACAPNCTQVPYASCSGSPTAALPTLLDLGSRPQALRGSGDYPVPFEVGPDCSTLKSSSSQSTCCRSHSGTSGCRLVACSTRGDAEEMRCHVAGVIPLVRKELTCEADLVKLEAQLAASLAFLRDELPVAAARLAASSTDVFRAVQEHCATEVRLPIVPRRRLPLDFSRLNVTEFEQLAQRTVQVGEVLAQEVLDSADCDVGRLRQVLQGCLDHLSSVTVIADRRGSSVWEAFAVTAAVAVSSP